MDTHEIPTTPVNPWHPISNPVDLKHLGKLGEEAGELAAIANRCIIQDVDMRDPSNNKPNRERLEDELADVMANSQLVRERFNLDLSKIMHRASLKYKALQQWHAMA